MPTTGKLCNSSRDVSLYFHIPFCSKKCPYCHFFVLPDDPKLKNTFLPALLKEWRLRLPQLESKQIVSIYFGGGTPTRLDLESYKQIFSAILQSGIEIAPDCEITLEGNPEDITLPLMQQFAAFGVNRVSLGVQSLLDEELLTLGRIHSANRSLEAIQIVSQAGIENLSIDLMFELPSQTLTTWEKTLRALSTLPITHLSLYNLTFEPHTVFFKKQKELSPRLPPEEERLQMLQMAVQSLEGIGLQRYEISAFSRSGRHSRHNTGYWTGRPFFGFGPSAFSYWDGARFSNYAHFNKYLTALEEDRLPVDFHEQLPYPDNLKELLAVRLRLVEGVDLAAFTHLHGPLPPSLEQSLRLLEEKKWITRSGSRIQLTPSGQLFYDSVASEII